MKWRVAEETFDPDQITYSIREVGWPYETQPALVGGRDKEHALQNARLIAAAPDLLEACKAFITAYDGKIDYLSEFTQDRLSEVFRAAITKAEGGKT